MMGRKVMVIGEIGVGKSSLVRRLVDDRFSNEYQPTLGADVYTYRVPETEHAPAVTLILWDTDGNFGETIFTHVYMRGAAAALVVGDISRPATLTAMRALGRGFASACPGRYLAYIVNKMDLVDAARWPDAVGGMLDGAEASVTATSALTGDNVRCVFHDAAAAIVRRGL
ncbi:MAG: GTP-binding protein [Hyphomicrobiaceae bacterium]|nr:GTP-binding protein [Hyphomicrobiaceae bacterium]